MMTAIAEQPPQAQTPEETTPMLVLENVSWETYESLLHDQQEQYVRITYDQGRMTVMSPLPKHEYVKVLVGRMVGVLAMELNIPICSLGQTTWRRRDLLKGLEPDGCFYVQHEAIARGREEYDLTKIPPPDLVLEVDVTHHPIDRTAIYAALGVPEMWLMKDNHVQPHKLEAGKYIPIELSLAFPFLRPEDLERFLAMRANTDE